MMSLADRVAEAARSDDPGRLQVLAEDTSPQVRREVAANPGTTANVLDSLAGDRDWRVRAAVGLHPTTTDSGLRQLIDDPRWEVRLMMLDRPGLTVDVMRAIYDGDQDDARHVLAQQQRIPLEIAHRLASDPSWQVRRALAENTVFHEVRTTLRNDPRPVVRRLAEISAHHELHRPADPAHPPPNPREPSSPQFTSADLAHWPTPPRKPSTKWLKIYGNVLPNHDEIHPHVVLLWQVAHQIDQDLAWIEWWSHANVRTLHLHPAPIGRGDHIDFHAEPNLLHVAGSSARLSGHLMQIIAEHGEDAAADALEHLADPLPQLFHDLVTTMLHATARHLMLPSPPTAPALSAASRTR